MRIAHFAQTFSSLSETFIYDGVTELERQGLENHVLTLNRTNTEERPFDKTHVVEAPHFVHPRRLWHRALAELGIGSFGRNEKDWTSWPVLRRRMKKVMQRVAPDVIHAQFGPAGVIIAPVACALDVPLVVTFHGFDVTQLVREARWQEAYQPLFEQTSLLIGSSHVCKKLHTLQAPSRKIRHLDRGIRLNRFEYRERSSSADEESVGCLYVGRLTEKKGPALLIEAFDYAQKQLNGSPELHLTIAGDGALREDTEQRINELKLGGSIELLGAIPHQHVARLMHEADLYTQHCVTAANGDQEGLGVSFIEASATGLPIVATRHNGLTDVIAHEETGLLVEERDIEAMGRCIAELATDPERRQVMGRAGRKHVEEHFDLEQQMRKLISLYEGVIASEDTEAVSA